MLSVSCEDCNSFAYWNTVVLMLWGRLWGRHRLIGLWRCVAESDQRVISRHDAERAFG